VDDLRQLLESVKAGDPDALWRLVESFGPHVMRVIRRKLSRELRTRFDSADFAQQIWLSVLCHGDRIFEFNTPEELVRYLAGITRNKLNLEYRRQFETGKRALRRERAAANGGGANLDDLTVDAPTPSEFAMARERWQQLEAGLDPRDREILQLKYSGHTNVEIAAQLSINERTVRRLLDRLAQQVAE